MVSGSPGPRRGRGAGGWRGSQATKQEALPHQEPRRTLSSALPSTPMGGPIRPPPPERDPPAPPHPLGSRDTGAQRGSAGCGAQGGGGCFSPRVYWRRGRRPAAPGWRPRCGHFYSHPLKRLKCLRGTKATEKNWKRLTPTPTPGKGCCNSADTETPGAGASGPSPRRPAGRTGNRAQGALSTAQLRLWGNTT